MNKKEELKKTKVFKAWRDNPAQYVLNVPRSFCLRFDLTPAELMIFEEIHLYTHYFIKECYCASRAQLQILINGSAPTVDKALNNLVKKGFIVKTTKKMPTKMGTERLNICYRSCFPKEISDPKKAHEVNDTLETILKEKSEKKEIKKIVKDILNGNKEAIKLLER